MTIFTLAFRMVIAWSGTDVSTGGVVTKTTPIKIVINVVIPATDVFRFEITKIRRFCTTFYNNKTIRQCYVFFSFKSALLKYYVGKLVDFYPIFYHRNG